MNTHFIIQISLTCCKIDAIGIPGEHKKVAPPPATFFHISAVSVFFCMKFYVTVKQSNIHFITKS